MPFKEVLAQDSHIAPQGNKETALEKFIDLLNGNEDFCGKTYMKFCLQSLQTYAEGI